eukprot:g68404.t1
MLKSAKKRVEEYGVWERKGEVLPFSNPKKTYREAGKIGEGAFGVVTKAEFVGQDSGVSSSSFPEQTTHVALKQMKVLRKDEGVPLHTYHEIKILNELRTLTLAHGSTKKQDLEGRDNIVSIHNRFMKLVPDREITLVYAYAEHDLSDIIRIHRNDRKKCDPRIVKSVIWQTLKGLHFLHRNWVMHRDIKPANILVMGESSKGDRGKVKVADFGLARIFQEPMKSLAEDGDVVTIWYRAPELLLGAKHYTKAIDVWAAGCIFAELYLCTALFPGEEIKQQKKFQEDQLKRIFKVLGKPDEREWPGIVHHPHYDQHVRYWSDPEFQFCLHKKLKPYLPKTLDAEGKEVPVEKTSAYDLLKRMLAYDPAKRITAKDALKHPFFQEDPKPNMNAFLDSQENSQRFPSGMEMRHQREATKTGPERGSRGGRYNRDRGGARGNRGRAGGSSRQSSAPIRRDSKRQRTSSGSHGNSNNNISSKPAETFMSAGFGRDAQKRP